MWEETRKAYIKCNVNVKAELNPLTEIKMTYPEDKFILKSIRFV